MEGVLRKALSGRYPVVLMYLSEKGLISKRVVSVEKFDDQWVHGYCHLRKAYRRFQVKNILAVLPASSENKRGKNAEELF